VVTLDANSQLTEGADAHLWLDPTRIFVFDPVSGQNLTRDLTVETRAPHSVA
jgi:hypothetical protein